MADVVQITLPDGNTYDIKDTVARGMGVLPATVTPLMDGVGNVGTVHKYALEDHVHPTDTSRQATLVSGTNIKTINGTSVLGSGDITTPNTTYTLSGAVSSHKFTATLTPSSGTATKAELTLSGGTGLSLSDSGSTITINHSNSVTAGTVGTSSATSGSTLNVPWVTYDAQGHITNTGTHVHTVTGFLPIYNGTGRNETFRWNFQTNNDPDDYPYMRLHGFSTSTSEGTQYGVSLGPVYGSGDSSYYWMTNPELDRFQFSNSGFRIGADQGSDVTTKWSGLNGTWFVGNQSSQYNGTYGFLGKESVDNTNYCGFKLEPYSGEIKFRSYADRTGSDTVINKTKVDKWDDHTVNGNYNLTAATTQAVYPIKIDSRGHISAHGNAVTVPTASTTNPSMDGTASYGSGTSYARSNHVHPTDTSRAAKANFVSFTVSNTTNTRTLTAGHIYLLITKRMNNSAAGGIYIVAPHGTTGSVTQIAAGASTTVSISTTTLTITTTVNNIYCRLIDLDMPN